MNMELFRLINNLANKNTILDKTMIFFSKYVPYIFMAVLALIFILGIINRNENCKSAAFNTFICTVINLGLSFIIGKVFFVARPFVNNKVNLLLPHAKNASFPSDHAIGTMSIALGLEKYNKVIGAILAVLSIIVGFSRVYVGHHYPSDVIGGYVIAIITNYLYDLVLKNKAVCLFKKMHINVSE